MRESFTSGTVGVRRVTGASTRNSVEVSAAAIYRRFPKCPLTKDFIISPNYDKFVKNTGALKFALMFSLQLGYEIFNNAFIVLEAKKT